jgi:hypothetical protein
MNAEEIFFAAVAIASAAEQSNFILHVCGENEQLRNEVESLLRAHERAGTFLQQPFVNLTDSRTIPDDPGT